ncbi:hypothetical protein Tco_0960354, partial [Tanacetum coccineum]
VGALDVCVDLTGSSPLTQTRIVGFVPSRAVIDETQCKRVKYKAKCADIGYGFLPFSFSSFGELENDAAVLLKRIRHKPLRPVDMFPYSWNEWLNVAQRKYVKYEAKCADIGYGFLPFTFSSFRELEKDAVTILKRIRKFSVTHDIMACNVVHIFSSISFGIVTPRQGGNTRRNIMDIITTQWCQQ